MASDWMKALATCLEDARREFPGARLMLLCDVDGTIIDMRHAILHVLHAYDAAHETRYFERLQVADITVHENRLDRLVADVGVPEEQRPGVIDWFVEHRWTPEVILAAHQPFRGVLDVIRWFQIQPDTTVGLVTGRPEELRAVTLRSLNQLGELYRVEFTSDLLCMSDGQWEENVPDVKVAGLKHFLDKGYQVFAYIDNEPSNLEALVEADPTGRMLMLHADTIFESERRVPGGTVRGKDYRLEKLIAGAEALPARVQLAWHGVNDKPNLRQFIASEVGWAEVDVRLDPTSAEPILRHDSFATTPLAPGEQWLTLNEVLDVVRQHDRSVKLDLKAPGELLDHVLPMLEEKGFTDDRLWFNGNIERLTERGFRRLVAAHAKAIIQCPIDFLAPLMLASPDTAKETLEMLGNWGVNRFSVNWEQHPELRQLFELLDSWGYEVNIYNVPVLEAFLQAVLLLPTSVTSDFNFPQWSLFGHGPGKGGERISYRIEEPAEGASTVG